MSFESFEKLPGEKKDKILSAGIREFSQKSYNDAGTDRIIEQCQISKGILFHYFGSKKKFYLYCLEKSMERLTSNTETVTGKDFYEILFMEMDRKMSLCMKHKDETHMVNMASRDASMEIAAEKTEILQKYAENIHAESAQTLRNAMAALNLKNTEKITTEGLQLYINAIMNKYLLQYQAVPDQFFEQSETIKAEMKTYIDLMLYGICKEEL